jgi:hypothetical protein
MNESGEKQKLVVVWSSADPDVAIGNVFMYTKNSMLNKWWPEVRLIVWGPSTKLLAADKSLQKELAKVAEAGVELLACRSCTELFGVTEELEKLGIEVIHTGAPLTKMLKEGWACLTY